MNSRERVYQNTGSFLPDFCGINVIFFLVVIAQLLAFILTLARTGIGSQQFWADLSLISLFVQWCALTNAAVLCLLRKIMQGQNVQTTALLSFTAIVMVSTLIAMVAVWVLEGAIRPHLFSFEQASDFVLRTLVISAIIAFVLLRYLYVNYQWKRNLEVQTHAKLSALQARIRPHFLFNSMNTIANLTQTNASLAEEVTQDLADLFRASLRADDWVKLKDELDLIRQYLHVESIRLGERMQVEWDIEALPINAYIPQFLVQPLVENAVYHGVEASDDGARIMIVGRQTGDTVEINIANTCSEGTCSRRQGNQVALDNIKERLNLLFGSRAGIVTSQSEQDYSVTIHFPRYDEIPSR